MIQDRGFRAIAFSILSNGLATSAKVQSSDVGAQARQAALAARTPPSRERPNPKPPAATIIRLALDLRQAQFAGELACNFMRRRDVVLRIVVDAGIAGLLLGVGMLLRRHCSPLLILWRAAPAAVGRQSTSSPLLIKTATFNLIEGDADIASAQNEIRRY